MSQVIDQPGRSQPSHPVADHRNALPEEEELEVTMPQRAPRMGKLSPNLRGGLGATHISANLLMISPAASNVSCSCLSSLAIDCASHICFASLVLLRTARPLSVS